MDRFQDITLSVASDESDFEDDVNQNSEVTKITLRLVDEWEKELTAGNKNTEIICTVVKGFRAALLRVTGDDSVKECVYKVDGSSVFNAVVRLCVTNLYPCIKTIMKLPSTSVTSKHVTASKFWFRLKSPIRCYILDLIKIIGNVTSPDILSVLLKHLHQMLPFALCLPTIYKGLLKRLMVLWSTNEDDTVRVISFLCILYMSVSNPSSLHTILKMMYASYVSNSKFVSPSTLPGINFMRRSLTELFALNENVSYSHAFLYIRQLAIHLRSAVTLKKKESMQTVYTWRYINSLRLWVDVLCASCDKPQMKTLIYPTIQVIIGCIKLIPTVQYLPLRYHCVQMLIQLTRETGVYIPVLPFLLEVLSLLNVNNQHTKLSMKPMDFKCVLRLSKLQMHENAFKDAVVEYLYQYLLEYTTCESHRISFPDLVVPAVVQLKHFLKECKNVNYNRKLKQIIEKIEDNSKLINVERSKSGISLTDRSGIESWESNMKLKGTPLSIFYDSWLKIHRQQMARKVTDTVQISEFNLPTLIKPTTKKSNKKDKVKKENGRYELFSSDDDEVDDNTESFTTKLEDMELTKPKEAVNLKKKKAVETPMKKKKMKKTKMFGDNEIDESIEQNDIITDFDISDFMSQE